ncbi:MAG TPA: methyltransferase domain-containing protein [Vitreimonas sp.]|nr:methyltransferase domain-containing protein [Vitreimonas sp.]
MRKNPRSTTQRTHSQPSQAGASPTSWQPVSHWYHQAVGESGHYYHQHVVLPNVLRLLNLNTQSTVLDLACGQGILERSLPESVVYHGVDAAPSLVKQAQTQAKSKHHTFSVGDITKNFTTPQATYSHATIILALQNIAEPHRAIHQAASHLDSGGQLVLVINHPYFRIPRQSSWQTDETKKIQYRRIDRYLTPLKIPITAHPGKTQSAVTWSFHQPLSAYVSMLNQAGLVIINLEEWTSDKQSIGKTATMENRSRQEFPLFMCLVAKKS